jgi:Anti-sigma-K factor rskA, C-terminal
VRWKTPATRRLFRNGNSAGIASAEEGPSECEHFRGSRVAGAERRRRRALGVTVHGPVSLRRPQKDKAGGQEIPELAALADGSLAPERRAALEARVAKSSELADRLAEQRRAVALTRSAAAEVEAPAALRARIDAQRHARSVPVPRRLVLIGATAAAVLAVAVGLTVFRSGTSAERFHAALAPTVLAPGARGEATLTKTSSGWRIELDAKGLPRIAAGRFYEAWLRNAAGVLVPIGSFNEGRKVTLWAGVSPRDFTTLTVTRERANGEQASSGEKVLVGTVDLGESG